MFVWQEKDTVTKRESSYGAKREISKFHHYCQFFYRHPFCSLARLKTPKPQAHTGIEIEEPKSKCH